MHWLLCTLLCACAALGVSFGLSAQISEEPMLPASQFQQLDNQYKELKNQWKNYKYKYNKQYENEDEERHRLVIYSENMRRVAEHNARHDQGLTTYTMELNRFADMTHQEFIDTMLMENMSNLEDQEYVSEFRWNKSMGPIPQKMDWRNQGAVTPVKDQGYCRSCWAFSATGALEGQHYIKWRRLVSLSEQNLLDCSKSFGNYACKGGYVATSYNYIRMNGGIDTEYSYPYEGKVDTCRLVGLWDVLLLRYQFITMKTFLRLSFLDSKNFSSCANTSGSDGAKSMLGNCSRKPWKEDKLPTLKLRLGRVTSIHSGADGFNHVADRQDKAGC